MKIPLLTDDSQCTIGLEVCGVGNGNFSLFPPLSSFLIILAWFTVPNNFQGSFFSVYVKDQCYIA